MTRPVLPLLEYVANKDYIAEVLCINKEKVELNCQGKCYLMQQLSTQENNKNPQIPKVSLEEYPIGFIFIAKINLTEKFAFISKDTAKKYCNLYSFLFNKSSFHPPTFS